MRYLSLLPSLRTILLILIFNCVYCSTKFILPTFIYLWVCILFVLFYLCLDSVFKPTLPPGPLSPSPRLQVWFSCQIRMFSPPFPGTQCFGAEFIFSKSLTSELDRHQIVSIMSFPSLFLQKTYLIWTHPSSCCQITA